MKYPFFINLKFIILSIYLKEIVVIFSIIKEKKKNPLSRVGSSSDFTVEDNREKSEKCGQRINCISFI